MFKSKSGLVQTEVVDFICTLKVHAKRTWLSSYYPVLPSKDPFPLPLDSTTTPVANTQNDRFTSGGLPTNSAPFGPDIIVVIMCALITGVYLYGCTIVSFASYLCRVWSATQRRRRWRQAWAIASTFGQLF